MLLLSTPATVNKASLGIKFGSTLDKGRDALAETQTTSGSGEESKPSVLLIQFKARANGRRRREEPNT